MLVAEVRAAAETAGERQSGNCVNSSVNADGKEHESSECRYDSRQIERHFFGWACRLAGWLTLGELKEDPPNCTN